MAIYIIILLIGLLACANVKKGREMGFLLFLLMFAICALRDESVGIDTINYFNNIFSYEYDVSTEGNHRFELLFMGACELIRKLGLPSQLVIWYLSFITYFFFFLTTRKYRIPLSCFCVGLLLSGVFIISLNIARQIAACSILLYAYTFLANRKGKLKFVFFVICAAMIHISSMLALIMLPLSKINYDTLFKNRLTYFIVFIALFAVLQILRATLINKLMSNLGLLVIYSGIGENAETSTLSLFGFFYRSVAVVFNLLFWIKTKPFLPKATRSVFLFTILFRILLSPFYGNITRILWLFSINDIVIYATVIMNRRRIKGSSELLYLLFVAYSAFEYISVLTGDIYEVVPYKMSLL